jgi:protein TonB
MFESVVPETFKPRSRRVFYETLPISIAVHVIGIGAGFGAMFWNVAFPTHYPRMIVAYNLTQVPDPPPPPPPPPKPEAPRPVLKLSQLAPPPPAPTQIVAPTVIPDIIPEVKPPDPTPPPPPPPPMAAPARADFVPPAGATGQVGGTGHGIGIAKGITLEDDGRVHVERGVDLPLKEVEHPYPHYPEAARKARLEGTCVVRYTIGKNGRVIDIAVLDHTTPMFDDETINTIRNWRYRPMMVSGKPVEVVHELAVNYQFISR